MSNYEYSKCVCGMGGFGKKQPQLDDSVRGKTKLASTVALTGRFSYVDVISPELMTGYSQSMISHHILKVMEKAHGEPYSFILIDNIEKLILHKSDGDVANALLSILTSLPPKGNNMLVVGTTTNLNLLESNGILGAFSSTIEVGALDKGSIKVILESVLGPFRLFQDKDYADAATAIGNVPMKKLYRALSFSYDGNEDKHFDCESLNRCIKFLQVAVDDNPQTSGVNEYPEVSLRQFEHKTPKTSKGEENVAKIRVDVDRLEQQFSALEAGVDHGSGVDKEITYLSELLTRQLLKLDRIQAEGEGKTQRKIEI